MPTPEINVLFFYPVNGQPTFSVYSFPSANAEPQQLLVLALALINTESWLSYRQVLVTKIELMH
jgi:hypothetical protein